MKQEPLIESRMEEEIRIPLKALTRVTIACLGSKGKPCGAETTVDLAATRPQNDAKCPACGGDFDNLTLNALLRAFNDLKNVADRVYFRGKKYPL
jgi:hypothetical protein